MGTNVTPEVSQSNKYYISKHRSYELRHFCLQYKEWKEDYCKCEFTTSPNYISVGDSSTVVDKTGDLAVRRALLDQKIKLVEHTALVTDPELASYILLCVTEGLSFNTLKTKYNIPCGKDYFYERFRKFFWLLDKKKR